MLPLLLFVVVELVWGTTAGLIAALILGVLQLCWYWFRERRVDKFVLADIGFMVILGGLAILFSNAFLFKLKPVFIGAALLLLIGYSAFSDHNLVMLMSRRYLKGFVAGPLESWMMQQMLKLFFWLLAAHTLLTLAAALWMSHAWWAAISGPGFYVLFALMVAVSWMVNLQRKKEWSKEEWVPIVDEEGKVEGVAPRSMVHNGKTFWLHPVVHLQVITPNGLWLQKRPTHKSIQPGKWDTAVGGHVNKAEDIQQALIRETREEIGLDLQQAAFVGRYLWRSKVEKELVFVFAIYHEGTLHPNSEELDGGKTWTFEDIETSIGNGVFTPNFEEEYRRFANGLKKISSEKSIVDLN